MCGFTGYLAQETVASDNARAIVGAMAQTLHHRGPDDSGIWAEGPVALGHTRLSVIDLSPAGAQPMQSTCGRYVIAFNGEIYNHLELRKELESAGGGEEWRGHSDTETLLAAVKFWGLDAALQRFLGMFAFALFDRREGVLSLSRDRMGEKPLYWGWAGDAIVFGSELKSLKMHPRFDARPCMGAVAQYLRFCYVPAPQSIYTGVFKLEPGTVLEVRGSPPKTPPSGALRPDDRYENLAIRRYWSLHDTVNEGAARPICDPDNAITELEDVLGGAVKRQMISDVPLGAFLSGGIDSSMIVALMQRDSARPVKSFTVSFEEAGFNEAPYAAAVAKHLGTDHTELPVTSAEALDVVPRLPTLYDEPFGDSSQIPTHLVCRAARTQAKVALSGDGGDELFGGYNRYFWGPRIWNKFSWMPKPLRNALGATISSVSTDNWDRLGTTVGRFSGAHIPQLGHKVHKLSRRLQTVASTDDLYRSLVSEWEDPTALIKSDVMEPPSQLDDPIPAALHDDPVGRMMFQDMRSYMPDDILCKVDRAAMHTSLETRSPFLDPHVVELSQRLPLDMKVRGGTGKWALRQLLYKYVPPELIDRPKAGFAIPVGAWVRGPLRDWAESLLEDIETDDILHAQPIREIWQQHLNGTHDWTPRLWAILMFQAWRREAESGN